MYNEIDNLTVSLNYPADIEAVRVEVCPLKGPQYC